MSYIISYERKGQNIKISIDPNRGEVVGLYIWNKVAFVICEKRVFEDTFEYKYHLHMNGEWIAESEPFADMQKAITATLDRGTRHFA